MGLAALLVTSAVSVMPFAVFTASQRGISNGKRCGVPQALNASKTSTQLNAALTANPECVRPG